ncbi:MAG: hypothetical protein H6702_06865 [Myxococcales bacterium]|nr:hypothetical protein [Myxococcales bacterium]
MPAVPDPVDLATDASADAGPPDGAPADARPQDAAMGPCGALPGFEARDGRFVYEGETTDDAHTHTCGGRGGDDRALRFIAPAAGRWRFHVDAAEFDPLIALRADCLLAESERACNDDLRYPRRRDAAAQADLAAGEAVFVVVDAFVSRGLPRGGRFRVVAERVPVVAADGACDPLGLVDGCPRGTFCAPDDPQRLGGAGTCTVDAPPELMAAQATRDGDDLAVRVEGRDRAGDAAEIRLQLFQGAQRLPLDDHGADTWVLPLEATGEVRFERAHRGPLLAGNRHADAIELWLVDARGQTTPRARLVPEPSEARAVGDACDPHEVVDHCPAGSACRGTPAACVTRSAPVVEAAEAWWAADPPAFALEVHGHDPDGDVVGAWVAVFDADGQPSGEASRPFDGVASAPDGGFTAWLGFPANPEVRVAHARVGVVDAEGLASEPAEAEVTGPVAVAAGDACDPWGARTRCPAGTHCVGQPAACAVPAATCPQDAPVAALEPAGEGRFEARLVLSPGPGVPPATCGGGAAPVAVPFTPVAGGRWILEATADSADGDPVLSVRTHCAHAAAWSELACNDDRAPGDLGARLAVTLAPGAPVYVVVDGYQGPEGYWAGPVTLTARPAD